MTDLKEALDWLVNCVECEVNVPRTTTVFQLRLAQAKEALERAGSVDPAQAVGMREALRDLLDYVDRNTCAHEETHRGGAIWTICDSCGAKWADDEGGFQPHRDAPSVAKARSALAAQPSAPVSPSSAVTTHDLSCAADFLDDIEVDENGKCEWTAVANAQTHIRAALRCWRPDDLPQTLPDPEASLPTYGNIPWDQLGRDVMEAITARRSDYPFNPETYPGHQIPGINFNSLARIVDKYRAASAVSRPHQPSQASQSPEDEAEHFIQAAIDTAPEPLRRLGEFLADVLDEDHWKAAERLLLALAVPHQPTPSVPDASAPVRRPRE